MTVRIQLLLWAVAIRSGARALSVQTPTASTHPLAAGGNVVDRPLLRDFGRGINERILDSRRGKNRFGSEPGSYTSVETIPTLRMEVVPSSNCGNDAELSTRRDVRRAYAASVDGTCQTRVLRTDGVPDPGVLSSASWERMSWRCAA